MECITTDFEKGTIDRNFINACKIDTYRDRSISDSDFILKINEELVLKNKELFSMSKQTLIHEKVRELQVIYFEAFRPKEINIYQYLHTFERLNTGLLINTLQLVDFMEDIRIGLDVDRKDFILNDKTMIPSKYWNILHKYAKYTNIKQIYCDKYRLNLNAFDYIDNNLKVPTKYFLDEKNIYIVMEEFRKRNVINIEDFNISFIKQDFDLLFPRCRKSHSRQELLDIYIKFTENAM